MKALRRRELWCFVVLGGLCLGAALLAAGLVAGKEIVCEETTIVSCLPGEEPGQYLYRRSAAENFRPKCFGIDPNDGAFYIPEVDTRYNIRLHKFDPNGKFIKMLKLEVKTNVVTLIAVSMKGDIYLGFGKLRGAGALIFRYNKEGELLGRFGPKGPITPEELEAENEAERKHQINPIGDKYFPHWIGRIFCLPNGELLILRGYRNPEREKFRFDAVSGRLLEHTKKTKDMPAEIAQIRTSHLEKYEALCKWHKKQGRPPSRQDSLIGPDGDFYYMSVTPERLEIRKVTFHEK